MKPNMHKLLMSLVLVYVGTPTIFTNFRTFIQLYFTIFHSYITPLHHSLTLQFYLAPLCRTSIPHQRHITSYIASPLYKSIFLAKIQDFEHFQRFVHHFNFLSELLCRQQSSPLICQYLSPSKFEVSIAQPLPKLARRNIKLFT